MLVVEDSRVTRTYVCRLLEAQAGFTVVDTAADGLEAVRKSLGLLPDVVLMDLHLPKLDGLAAIERIMSEQPCPIVVLSGELTRGDVDYAFEALRAGAVNVISKPQGIERAQQQSFAAELVRTLRLMSRVKVVTKRSYGLGELTSEFGFRRTETSDDLVPVDLDLIAIGASTGGPPLLHELLQEIEAPAKVPILMSQHITDGFEYGLCSWLRTTGHDVSIPLPGQPIEPGKVYLSPANASLMLGKRGVEIKPQVGNEITPNVDRLFESVARICGERSVGVLLTGMGRDGADGLARMRAAGAWTIAQDEESSVVYGMPRAAAEVGAAREVLSAKNIAARLREIASSIGEEDETSRSV